MAFYGAIEQLLTGWIFDILPAGEEDFERAKRQVVQTVCEGLEEPIPRTSAPASDLLPRDA